MRMRGRWRWQAAVLGERNSRITSRSSVPGGSESPVAPDLPRRFIGLCKEPEIRTAAVMTFRRPSVSRTRNDQ